MDITGLGNKGVYLACKFVLSPTAVNFKVPILPSCYIVDHQFRLGYEV